MASLAASGGDIAKYRDTIRKQNYKTLCSTQRRIKRLRETITIEESALKHLHIVRGAPFDIDQDAPLDPECESRFFAPGPIDETLEALEETEYTWKGFEPIEITQKSSRRCDRELENYDLLKDAHRRSGFIGGVCQYHQTWVPSFCMISWYDTSRLDRLREFAFWRNADGQTVYHKWEIGGLSLWSRRRGSYISHEDMSHACADVSDTNVPRDGAFLKSELMVVTAVMKTRLRSKTNFIDHRVHPVLLMSFHGRFSARVVQAFMDENGRMVLRASRLIDLHTNKISSEVQLALRWTNCQPVRDTRWPAMPLTGPTDDATKELKADDPPQPHAVTVEG